MTELELHRGATLSEQMNFARLVADGSILPDAYRRNPSNVLIAVGLGQAMGLSPAESLYRIAVIKGKPTAGAELIAANVRRAGHKLRVITDEKAVSVKAVIIRSDDPDFPHEVVRDMEWAKAMGLASNDNYRKQPLTMLQWRAITAVARLAAPEALYGVQYTPDEMYDSTGGQPPVVTVTVEQVTPRTDGSEGSLAETSVAEGEAGSNPAGNPSEPSPLETVAKSMTARTRGELFALFEQKGVAEADQLSGANHINGTAHESRSQITEAEALAVIKLLRTRPDAVSADA